MGCAASWRRYTARRGATRCPTCNGFRTRTRAYCARRLTLIEHMDDAPVLLLACIEHGGSTNLTTGSSIYPAVQNILLAARGLGLGSVLTTFHKQYEDEVREILGIPDNVETAALLPIGYPADGVRYGPTRRKPMEEVTHWDGWNGG